MMKIKRVFVSLVSVLVLLLTVGVWSALADDEEGQGKFALGFNGGIGSSALTALGAPVTTQIDNLRMEALVNWNGSTFFHQIIVYNGNSGVSGWGIIIIGSIFGPPDVDKIAILAGGVAYLIAPVSLTPGTWQHVRAERQAGKWTLTVDDMKFSPGTYTPVKPVGGTSSSSEQTSVGTGFNGLIDDVRIRSVKPSTLIERWKFEEGAGTTAIGVKGHVLTLTNTTWVPLEDEEDD